MSQIFKVTYSRDAYHRQLQTLVDFGESVEVRGQSTFELRNVITEVEEPWHHCILLNARHWNPWLAMSEGLWMLAGRNDIAVLEPYNSRIKDFSDDGETLYGAYGKRIFEQIDPLIERLRQDNSDRRAVLQIWDQIGPGRMHAYGDLTEETKDPPCNNLVYFKLRNGKLEMTVICRSNDIHWGLYAVNLPTFSMLQVYIAARLGVEVGTQTHLSNSLHVYTENPASEAITRRMIYKVDGEDRPRYPQHEKIFEDLTWVKSHEEFAEMCSAVLDGQVVHNAYFPPFLNFAANYLPLYKAYKEGVDITYKWPAVGSVRYPGWERAGRMFIENLEYARSRNH